MSALTNLMSAIFFSTESVLLGSQEDGQHSVRIESNRQPFSAPAYLYGEIPLLVPNIDHIFWYTRRFFASKDESQVVL